MPEATEKTAAQRENLKQFAETKLDNVFKSLDNLVAKGRLKGGKSLITLKEDFKNRLGKYMDANHQDGHQKAKPKA